MDAPSDLNKSGDVQRWFVPKEYLRQTGVFINGVPRETIVILADAYDALAREVEVYKDEAKVEVSRRQQLERQLADLCNFLNDEQASHNRTIEHLAEAQQRITALEHLCFKVLPDGNESLVPWKEVAEQAEARLVDIERVQPRYAPDVEVRLWQISELEARLADCQTQLDELALIKTMIGETAIVDKYDEMKQRLAALTAALEANADVLGWIAENYCSDESNPLLTERVLNGLQQAEAALAAKGRP